MTLRGRDAKADVASRKGNRGDPSPSEPRSPAAAKPGPHSEAMAAVQAIWEMDRHHNDYQEEPRRWKRLVEAIRALEARVAELEALLTEWMETPFFDDREPWRKWATGFKRRIRAGLRELP